MNPVDLSPPQLDEPQVVAIIATCLLFACLGLLIYGGFRLGPYVESGYGYFEPRTDAPKIRLHPRLKDSELKAWLALEWIALVGTFLYGMAKQDVKIYPNPASVPLLVCLVIVAISRWLRCSSKWLAGFVFIGGGFLLMAYGFIHLLMWAAGKVT